MSERNKSIFSECLEIFMHFGKSRNLAQTAKAFSISLSSASRQIRKLEGILELDLIVAGKRPFTLTSEGKRFYAQMDHEKGKIDEMIEELHGQGASARQLRIGFIESYTQASANIIRNCVSDVSAILNVTGTTDRLTQLFNAGEIDVIVTSELPTDIEKLRCFVFLQEPTLVVLPKKALATMPASPKWRNLSFCGLPYILSYKHSRSAKALMSFLATHEIALQSRIEVDNIGTKLGLIADGLGWSLVPITSLYQNRAILDDPAFDNLAFLASPSPTFNRRLMLVADSNFHSAFFHRLATELCFFSEKFILPWAREKFPQAAEVISIFNPNSEI